MNKRPGNSQQLQDRLEQNQLSNRAVWISRTILSKPILYGSRKKEQTPTLKSIESTSNIEPYGPAVVGSI
jgi:hypothetical protein